MRSRAPVRVACEGEDPDGAGMRQDKKDSGTPLPCIPPMRGEKLLARREFENRIVTEHVMPGLDRPIRLGPSH